MVKPSNSRPRKTARPRKSKGTGELNSTAKERKQGFLDPLTPRQELEVKYWDVLQHYYNSIDYLNSNEFMKQYRRDISKRTPTYDLELAVGYRWPLNPKDRDRNRLPKTPGPYAGIMSVSAH